VDEGAVMVMVTTFASRLGGGFCAEASWEERRVQPRVEEDILMVVRIAVFVLI
jgi:hypothetical protein